jgi:hypothetical protein
VHLLPATNNSPRFAASKHLLHLGIVEKILATDREKAGVRYSFANLEGMSWSDRPPPRNPHKRKR